MKTRPSVEELKERLSYDPETGIFTWRVAGKGRRRGSVGYTRKDGYRVINIGGIPRYAHRVAWALVTGVWPENTIDHINGDRADNRFENLRDVSYQHNTHNICDPQCNNKSGLLGAYWNAQRGKWYSTIGHDNKTKYLGLFNTPERAHAAYCKAKDELHPTHMRLRNADT